MDGFLLYNVKVAAALLVFYLFYRFLLKKETFHRFNRRVLVGTAVLSFLLPLCIITIHRPLETSPVVPSEPVLVSDVPEVASAPVVEASAPWWPMALTVLFWAGVAFVLARVLVSVLSIARIIRQGELVREEDGCKIIVTERDIDPFSWMKYIVLSRKDWALPHNSILAHEKAHIACGHSLEVLLSDVLSALQWFNPAIWMLRADLQELHEYEADDAVLRSGANIKEYQYLLIRKAVSKSGYSVANSFNHSILKNRITMMSKSKSPLSRGLRVLYALPLVCLAIGLQAQTVYVPVDKDSENKAVNEMPPAVVPEELVLQVRADGTVEMDGKVYTLAQIKDIVPPHEPYQPQNTVHIVAADDIRMGVINDVKDELRKIGRLKVNYASANGPESATRNMAPYSSETKASKSPYPEELLPGIKREDIIVVRLNSADKVFFGNKVMQEDAEMLQVGKAFLKEHGRATIFSFMADLGTHYAAYRHMQALLRQIYDEVRAEKAQELYGKSLKDLSAEERSQVEHLFPLNIYEPDLKRGRRSVSF